jgi:hypothetical protein
MKRVTAILEEQFAESTRLEKEISANIDRLKYVTQQLGD